MTVREMTSKKLREELAEVESVLEQNTSRNQEYYKAELIDELEARSLTY